MTGTESTRGGEVSSAPSPPRGPIPTPAVEALNTLLNASDAFARVQAIGDLDALISDWRAAVWDGACRKVVPLRDFHRDCLANPLRRPAHTTDTCRWATAEDQPYTRYPLITTSWTGGDS